MSAFLDRIAALAREGQPFATATVVARRPPVSAHLGDHAIVFADGRMEGFVGGACSREIVRQQALEALRVRHGRLVSIRPDAGAASSDDPEHVVVPMTCVSEGAVDVYVEPHLPNRRLVVIGATPVAEALARTAATLAYDVVRVVDGEERLDVERETASSGAAVSALEALEALEALLRAGGRETAVVVASQGHYDEQALEIALRCGVDYVGLVASRKRGATVRAFLEGSGVTNVAFVRIPAGLDLGARTPAEVALSILAEIVQHRPSQSVGVASGQAAGRPANAEAIGGGSASAAAVSAAATSPSTAVPAAAAASATAIDPICGMTVKTGTARHTAQHDGTAYYFCCASCRTKFLQEPARYVGRP